MTQLLTASEIGTFTDLQKQLYSVEYSAQHYACSGCSTEKDLFNAPKFNFTSSNGVTNFFFPPLSGSELGSLALFFSTSASFPYSVVFDHIPGFTIIACAVDGNFASLEFRADSKILHFMGINDSSALLKVTLDSWQLDELAESVLDSAAICK